MKITTKHDLFYADVSAGKYVRRGRHYRTW